MSSHDHMRQLRSMLKAARNEIEAFEATAAMHQRDQELQKRIKEAKDQGVRDRAETQRIGTPSVAVRDDSACFVTELNSSASAVACAIWFLHKKISSVLPS